MGRIKNLKLNLIELKKTITDPFNIGIASYNILLVLLGIILSDIMKIRDHTLLEAIKAIIYPVFFIIILIMSRTNLKSINFREQLKNKKHRKRVTYYGMHKRYYSMRKNPNSYQSLSGCDIDDDLH